MALNQGPGGGPKRRIRTRMQTVGNTCMVFRNRSIKPIPANWRELLADSVTATCMRPPKHFYGRGEVHTRSIEPPHITIPYGSLPTVPIIFTLDTESTLAYLQKRAIDWALRLDDVIFWPVPKVVVRTGKGGETFINSGLAPHDTATRGGRHSFNAYRLAGVDGINWRHLEAYTAYRGKGRYVGVKTTCSRYNEPCRCRDNLKTLWSLGWEMHS